MQSTWLHASDATYYHYVGMTTNKVRDRLHQHCAAVLNKKATSVSKHFSENNHSVTDMQLGLLESSISIPRKYLQVKEATWIHLLEATTHGINRKDETEYARNPNTTQIIKHFRHHIVCTPYLTAHIEDMGQNDLSMLKGPKYKIEKHSFPKRIEIQRAPVAGTCWGSKKRPLPGL